MTEPIPGLIRSGVLRFIKRIAIVLIGLLFLASSLTEAIDDTALLAAIIYQTSFIALSEGVIRGIALAVMVLEGLIGAALVVGWINRVSLSAAAVMVVAFSLLLLRMILGPNAPRACGCLSLGERDGLFGGEAGYAIVRNAVILVVLSFAGNLSQGDCSRAKDEITSQ
jgi:hypothetical protein